MWSFLTEKTPLKIHRFKDLESPQRYTPARRLWHTIGSVDLFHGTSRYQESQAEIDLGEKKMLESS